MLLRLAHRMTGSRAEAEDIVQEAWLRWSRAPAGLDAPAAWLRRATARLCIDHMRSARVRRERYVGPWLPEPLPAHAAPADDPHAAAERADEVTVALLLALDRLGPVERAAFLLHDVFDLPFDEVARVIGRSPDAARQIASRARRRVRDGRPHAAAAPERARFAAAFRSVLATGDVEGFARMLARDVALHVDAGGTKPSARRVLVGAVEVMDFLMHVGRGALAEGGHPGRLFAPVPLMGEEGYAVREPDGSVQLWTLDWCADGTIGAIHVQRSAQKLHVLEGCGP